MTDIRRQYLYIESGSESLFSWIHTTENCESSNLVAVICNPLGVEYMSGHRSIRRLADWLSVRGIAAIRFDYCCTGDSTGGEFQNVSVSQIIRDIRCAAKAARSVTGASRVALIGIGLGATFAAMAAEEIEIDQLVLWNPTVKGKRFIRAQKLLSEVLDKDETADSSAIDSAGLYLTAELQDQFRPIDLTKLSWSGKNPILLLSRSDMDSDRLLTRALEEKNLPFQHTAMPGYKEMMDQPTNTIVPVDSIELICDWLNQNNSTARDVDPDSENGVHQTSSKRERMQIPRDDVAAIELDEIPAWFGAHDHLFGITTIPHNIAQRTPGKRAFVFLNCGSEHHAGPHRMYTRLCRQIASHGELAFRFDLEGIGDSVSIGNNEENTPYSPVALIDIDQALQYLTLEYGCDEFILSGICAGAYHSFKAATELPQHNIKEANLINPLVFDWNYEDPADYHKYEVHTYRSAIRERGSWRRFFSGDIDYRRLLTSVSRHVVESARHLGSDIAQMVTGSAPKGLPGKLRTLRELRRPMTLILSESDPGLDIMKLQARRETRAAIRDGHISVHRLLNSNHGLSKKHMQDRLVSTIIKMYYT